jgi:hypothetical protein
MPATKPDTNHPEKRLAAIDSHEDWDIAQDVSDKCGGRPGAHNGVELTRPAVFKERPSDSKRSYELHQRADENQSFWCHADTVHGSASFPLRALEFAV